MFKAALSSAGPPLATSPPAAPAEPQTTGLRPLQRQLTAIAALGKSCIHALTAALTDVAISKLSAVRAAVEGGRKDDVRHAAVLVVDVLQVCIPAHSNRGYPARWHPTALLFYFTSFELMHCLS
jgi:hypothetical protein